MSPGVTPSLPVQVAAVDAGRRPSGVQADEDVVGTSRVRDLERRARELERLLGRKTMEVEILREALDVARVKKPRCSYRRGPIRRAVPNEKCGRQSRVPT
jgi:transposase